MNQLTSILSRQVNNSALIIWRICFGLLMLAESWGAIATGWVKRNLVDPSFTFSFFGFEWLQPLPGNGMYYYFFAMGLAALAVAVGWKYRYTTVLLALFWSGAYFMQKTSYNNHYYLAVLLCWWMAILPAANRFSLDARKKEKQATTHGYWISLFAKIQLLIVFTFGAVAKFYPGWLQNDFISHVFKRKVDFWLIGPLLGQEWFQWFITYSAILFDGLIIPLLWWKRTRVLALLGLLFFNLFNSAVFHIGIFPYLVLAFTVFFFEPEKIEKWFKLPKIKTAFQKQSASISSVGIACFVLYFMVQIGLPLRHHFIPGDVTWREEGHRLSWRMMLRAKGGTIALVAVDPINNKKERIKLREYLSPKQIRQIAAKPDFLYRFVQVLKQAYIQKGWKDTEIYVSRSKVYLNGKDPAPLYDDSVNLAQVSWNYWGANAWVLDHPNTTELSFTQQESKAE